jgi:hypothetical protein
MSKERELLKEVLKVFDSVYSRDLINEIEELLAKPEQEPVAWMYDWEDTPNGDGESVLLEDLVTNNVSIIRMSLACNVRPLYIERITGGSDE